MLLSFRGEKCRLVQGSSTVSVPLLKVVVEFQVYKMGLTFC